MSGASLRKRLTWLNISVMFCVLVPVGAFTYQRESRAMRDLLDGRLAEAARTVSALVSRGAQRPVPGEPPPVLGGPRKAVVSVDLNATEPSVGYQVFDPEGRPIVVTADFDAVSPPTEADLGFRTETIDGVPWRLFTMRSRTDNLVRIGERYDIREDIMRGLVIEHSLPLIIGLPLLALLLIIAVRQGLRPLRQLTDLLASRTGSRPEPIAMAGTTSELRPLIAALNDQFERLQDALERERRFNADVAHELRTPLAAAMIQLESAGQASDRAAIGVAIANAEQSLTRLARRVEQILTLSRLETGAATAPRGRCDLVELIKESIEELAPVIADRDIEASFDYDTPQAVVPGHEASLMAMLRNLIENALRYVPAQGRVAVTLANTPRAVVVEVSDNGPGIPADRRERVFDRFHREGDDRADGFGLGLSIVRQAARSHGAQVELSEPAAGTGLCVRVTVPRPDAPATWASGFPEALR